MKVILRILFLFLILYLILPFTGELIVSNPYLTNKTYNPINYKIIILSCNISREYFKINTSLLVSASQIETGFNITQNNNNNYGDESD